ncbi:MAG: glycosyltransferase family 4 protein [Deltaproteobacteria bacterium]|nr:glycosyltransferase family 4 protein [Deltaproteobacteria bacterium]
MRIALIGDVFPPLRSSGAVQLRDLCLGFARQGHEISMMVASPELEESFRIENWKGVQVVRLKTPKTKDTNYIRRTIGELLMPFFMLWHLRFSKLCNQKWDGIVWYSPTIFLGLLVYMLKKNSNCKSYLIIRDIFPEWAVDMGLMGRGLPYFFFKGIANFQYSVADVIGIQTPGNRVYFENWENNPSKNLEILNNWLAETPTQQCSITVSDTQLAGRKIFVYAGNMGIAQGMDILLELADQLQSRQDIGFLFVGRGSEVQKLRKETQKRKLENMLFFDEIDPDEISSLYDQCHVGLISLDSRHKSHNIPGKFLSYMQSGLPVLASVNDGNDLVALIESEKIGQVSTNYSASNLKKNAEKLIEDMDRDPHYKVRCNNIYKRLYSPDGAVQQIISALIS